MSRLSQVIDESRKIIIKIGSNVLSTSEGRVNREIVANIVNQVRCLMDRGKQVILVSLGAGIFGVGAIGKWSRRKDMNYKQALCAIGQVELMEAYKELFASHEIFVAQMLLTREDFNNEDRTLHMRNTMFTLVDEGVVPIIIKTSVDKFQSSDSHDLVADSYTKPAQYALIGIPHDKRVVVFNLSKILFSAEAIGLHAVLVGKFYEFTFKEVVTTAFQTAVGFSDSLFFREPPIHDFGEIILSLRGGELIGFFTAEPFTVFKCFFRNVGSFYYKRFFIFYGLAVQIRIYDYGSLSRIPYRFYGDRNFIVSAVSAGEHSRYARHESVVVIGYRVLPCLLDIEQFRVDSLTYRKYDVVHIESFSLSLYRHRATTTGSVRFSKFHALQNYLFYVAILIFYDFKRIC